jgi:copper chaperone CopZ
MIKTTVKINGMACSMCEAHICDVIRRLYPQAKKVSASHAKAEASFLTESEIQAGELKKAIDATGYAFVSCESVPYEKKGLFGRKA